MNRKFIIQGEEVIINIQNMRESIGHQDITSVGDKWRSFTPTGENKLELNGFLPNGEEIDGIFRVVNILDDNTLVIEPWSDIPSVGELEK